MRQKTSFKILVTSPKGGVGNKPEPVKPVVGNMVSRFLNRLTAGAI
jgi:hypothetical protein